MELFDNLAFGIATAASWQNLLFCFAGVMIGTLVGVLPGISPLTTIAMLLPFTFGLPPASALIMLAGIFYGAQYGSSTAAILVNVPGETSSILTCIDGYQMARQGRAGSALAIAAIASFFAGTVATLVIAILSLPLAALALKFTAVETVSLVILGLLGGIQPGPQVMTKQPELFWSVIASMWIGNLMLIVINLPLIGIWVSLLRVPYNLLFPAIVVFCAIGAYSINNSFFDLWLMLGFGLIGYFFLKIGVEPAPFVLGFVLGPMLEENFRRAMLIASGDLMVFIERPISAVLLACSTLLLAALLVPEIRRKREVLRE